MPKRRSRIFALGIVVTCLGLASCGTPPRFDAQEQDAFARECASLIVRDLANGDKTPRTITLDGEKLDLDDPAAFYAALARLRGPDAFDLNSRQHVNDTRGTLLDICHNNARRPGVPETK